MHRLCTQVFVCHFSFLFQSVSDTEAAVGREKRTQIKWQRKKNFQIQFVLLRYHRENICHGSAMPRECTRKSEHTNPQTHSHPHTKEGGGTRVIRLLRGVHSTVKETFWRGEFLVMPSYKLMYNTFHTCCSITVPNIKTLFYSAKELCLGYLCYKHQCNEMVVINSRFSHLSVWALTGSYIAEYNSLYTVFIQQFYSLVTKPLKRIQQRGMEKIRLFVVMHDAIYLQLLQCSWYEDWTDWQ